VFKSETRWNNFKKELEQHKVSREKEKKKACPWHHLKGPCSFINKLFC